MTNFMNYNSRVHAISYRNDYIDAPRPPSSGDITAPVIVHQGSPRLDCLGTASSSLYVASYNI